VHYVLGENGELSLEVLTRLVPDVAARDAYVCGPPAMVEATSATLRAAGVPRGRILTERFAL
jgi:ferredoxin-NADP reductase